MSSSDGEDLLDEGPPFINPYEVLSLGRDATEAQVKTAYRKAALKHHPDKVSPEKRKEAHETFQNIAFAYAILSDPVRRKRYDTTGSTSESIVDSDNFDWSEFYRAQFLDAVSADAIARFAAKYRHSDEEAEDVLTAYETHRGDLDALYETVMLSDVREDDERFRAIIDQAIKENRVPGFPAYTKETKKKRTARLKAAKDEVSEAEAYAKELGVHDKLFGASVAEDDGEDSEEDMPVSSGKAAKSSKAKGKSVSAKPRKKESSEDALAALIRSRHQERGSFLDALEAKYTAKENKKGGKAKSSKRRREEEPSEEEFLKIQAKLNGERKSGGRAKRSRS
ncbi:DnaJ domain-containing protein [Ceratocystis lukuohia]|uniref:DnaJ domain-containing protein n=1 Tax=Ceratocystis lukuohia TaxID=2019550 RepID=A0ABR4MJH3_9PEZI